MKHKLKLSFWALGILVLVFSQLLVLAPAPKAFAATGLFDKTQTNTYGFSVYMAFRSCLNGISSSTAINPSGGNMNFLPNTTAIVGFAGSDGNNEDGLVSCAEALNLWKSTAGYPDVTAALSDLGFQKGTQACYSGGPASQICNDTWVIGNGSKNSILDKQTSIAKAKSISTSLPNWGRYMLAYTALQAKCTSTPTVSGPAQTSTTSGVSTKVVADNTGALTTATYYPTTSESVSTFPGQQSDSSCKYLIDVVNDGSVGATPFSVAIANDRIDSTVNIAESAICEKLGLTGKAKDNCEVDFNGYLKTCIDSYYKGNAYAPTISRSEPFDTTVVSACVESKAKAGGYTITADEISSILSDAQTQTTPDTSATDTNTDPCAVLGNEIPMRWLACAILTAGSGMATTFYNMVQQLLYMPASSVFNDNFTKTAQSFRIIGMALIIIAGLVMIIAQATGSDLVDAYTIKKVLPKLGIALVGMAVALPLLKFAIQLTNDLGIAAGDVIVRLGGAQATGDSATIGDNIGGIFVGLAGVAVAGVVWGWAALTFIGTAALALLIGVIVLAIRQMALVVLVLIAPLAIAASVLPGTDKLWKFWRGTLLSTLMMFPIIMMFLKSGEFMAGIFSEMAADQNNGLFTVLAAIIYFAPYFMIPLAFKMAGGLISTVFGMMNDRGKGLFDRMSKFRSGQAQQRMSHYGGIAGGRVLQARYSAWNELKKSNGLGARIARRTIGGFNIEAEMSAYNAKYQKAMDDQINTGPDDLIRAYSVNKAYARQGGMEGAAREDGHTYSNSGLYRKNKDGTNEYRTLGGAWVKESMVDDSRHAFGAHNLAAYQKSLAYEMQKGITQEQQDDIVANYGALSRANGMTTQETNEVWKGAAFAKQNENRQWKHYGYDSASGQMRVNGLAFMREIDEKQGNYAMTMQNADTWTTMSQEMVNAAEVYNNLNNAGQLNAEQTVAYNDAKETLQRGARIAYSTAAASMATIPDDSGGGAQQVAMGGRQVGAGAPARVMEEMDAFVRIANDAAAATIGAYTPPATTAEARRALDQRGQATEVPGGSYQPAERPSTSPAHPDRGPDSRNRP